MPKYEMIKAETVKDSDDYDALPAVALMETLPTSDIQLEDDTIIQHDKHYPNHFRRAAIRQYLLDLFQTEYENIGGIFQFHEGLGHLPGASFDGYFIGRDYNFDQLVDLDAMSVRFPDNDLKHYHPFEGPIILSSKPQTTLIVTGKTKLNFGVLFQKYSSPAALPFTGANIMIPVLHRLARPDNTKGSPYRVPLGLNPLFSYFTMRMRTQHPRKFTIKTSSPVAHSIRLEFITSGGKTVLLTDAIDIPGGGTYKTTFDVRVPRSGFIRLHTHSCYLHSITTIPRSVRLM